MPIPFAELCAKTNYSFLRGASFPEEMVLEAQALGYAALGIADCDGVYGAPRAHQAAKKSGLPLIVGADVRLPDGPRAVLLAMHAEGYGNLCELLTEAHAKREATDRKAELPLDEKSLDEKNAGLLLLVPVRDETLPLSFLRERFEDRLYLVASRFHDGHDTEHLERAEALSKKNALPCLASNLPLFHSPRRKRVHDVLTAIRHTVPLREAGFRLLPNSERYLKPLSDLARLFRGRETWLERTAEVASRCHFSLDEIRYHYPVEWIPEGMTGDGFLEKLVWEGAARRFNGQIPAAMRTQLEHELRLIRELEYSDYFLTIWDIVEYARRNGILCQGRGSAANSCVCYVLGITAIDPVQMELLFERFLSRERREPPDIDIDFEHERREEVIQYIYTRYGRHRAAITAEVICFRRKSALREVAKVFDIDDYTIKRVQTLTHRKDLLELTPKDLEEGLPDLASKPLSEWLELSRSLLGYPRHLGTHVGGFVLCQDKLTRHVPVEKAAMPNRTIIQWDKDDLDSLGFVRVDILGLGILTAIRKSFALVEKHQARKLSLAEIPPDDPNVYKAICLADTVGVFQIESRAQMNMLPRLKPRTFFDLVVEISIVRPGPIQGEMVHPYLKRRNNEEKIEYAHPELEKILHKTFGVPLFQEQIMKMAMCVAGFSAGEADELRRAMGSWRKHGRLAAMGERFRRGLIDRGIPEEFADRIFSQIEGFAEYGFPESHAASFALIAYATAWLKVYYPAAFLAALLNSQPMGFYGPRTLIHDGERHGVRVLPVDINHSGWDHRLEKVASETSPALRLGFREIRGLASRVGAAIEKARSRGPFSSLFDFVTRVKASLAPIPLTRRDLFLCAGANAFDGVGTFRRRALWDIQALELPDSHDFSPADAPTRLPLEGGWERISLDFEAQGLSLFSHPIAYWRSALTARRVVASTELPRLPAKKKARTAGLVISRQMPPTKTGVLFLTLEDELGFANLVIWNQVFQRYREVLLTEAFLLCEGHIEKAEGGRVTHLIVSHAEPLLECEEIGSPSSHDFR